VYRGKQRNLANMNVIPIHATVLGFVQKVDKVGHKISMENYFNLLKLSDDLHHRKINAYGTIHHTGKRQHLISVLNIYD
jgi:hypothetical protein